MQKLFIERATETVIDLVEDGKIRKSMSDRQKAKVLYDWVIKNTTYDRSFAAESFSGYGQITNGKAVCQGYTATFNYMCKLLGIEVYGLEGLASGQGHLWTVAMLDGDKVHIDTTWGDGMANNQVDNSFFGASSSKMQQTHYWDEEDYIHIKEFDFIPEEAFKMIDNEGYIKIGDLFEWYGWQGDMYQVLSLLKISLHTQAKLLFAIKIQDY